MATMLADAAGGAGFDTVSTDPDAVPALLARKRIRAVTFEAWRRIDDMELAVGRQRGKPREKFTTLADLLAAAEEGRR